MVAEIILTICGFLLILAYIAYFIRFLFQVYKRQKHFATLRLNPEKIPLYTEQPFSLAISPSILTRRVSWKGHLLVLVFSVATAFILGLIYLPVLTFSPVTLPPGALFFGEIIIFSSAIVMWIMLEAIITPLFYQRITASETGLTVQRGLMRRHIAWSQARLFAVDEKKTTDSKNKATTLIWNELSGQGKVLRWEYDVTIPRSMFLKFTPAEYSQELACLRSFICAKTELPLRDLRSLHYERGKRLEKQLSIHTGDNHDPDEYYGRG